MCRKMFKKKRLKNPVFYITTFASKPADFYASVF